MLKKLITLVLLCIAIPSLKAQNVTYRISDFGVEVNSKESQSLKIHNALQKIKQQTSPKNKVTLLFDAGTYFLDEEDCFKKELYISNHDQDNPKNIGLYLDGWNNLTIEGNGAEFRFDGTVLPIVLRNSKNVQLQNFSIDFVNPHINQVEVMENRGGGGIVFRTEPWVMGKLDAKGQFKTYGINWEQSVYTGIAFVKQNKHILYRTSDLGVNLSEV